MKFQVVSLPNFLTKRIVVSILQIWQGRLGILILHALVQFAAVQHLYPAVIKRPQALRFRHANGSKSNLTARIKFLKETFLGVEMMGLNLNVKKISPKTTLAMALGIGLVGCGAVPNKQSNVYKETVYAVTASNKLISFSAGQPQIILSEKGLSGLQNQETIVGIDYRVAKGWLYALGSSGRLYRIDSVSGATSMVGTSPVMPPVAGPDMGFDFNPTVDRIRVVNSMGLNMRVHPDTGVAVDSDPNTPGSQTDGRLSYATGDIHANKSASLVAAAYTYNKNDEKITTNFAIDAMHGVLVTQGSREGKVPVVSPNTGQLFTVGTLGAGRIENVSFDIADVSGIAYMAARQSGASGSEWFEIDLLSGKAKKLGTIGTIDTVVGIAIEP